MLDDLAQLYLLRTSQTPGRSCPRGQPGTNPHEETHVKDDTKRAIRTAIQAAVGFAVALPAIVGASGIPETLPWVAGGLLVAGGFARVMALPSVQALLPSWLRTEAPLR